MYRIITVLTLSIFILFISIIIYSRNQSWSGSWVRNGGFTNFNYKCFQSWRCNCGNNVFDQSCSFTHTLDKQTSGSCISGPYSVKCENCTAPYPSEPCSCNFSCP